MFRFRLIQYLMTLGLTICLTLALCPAHNAVADQQAPHDSEKTGLPYIRTTATGSTLNLGNQLVYFEGLTDGEVRWIRDSFIYGGIGSALVTNATGFAIQHARALPSFSGIATLALQLSNLYSRSTYWYYTLKNIKQIGETGAWYMLPVFLRTILLKKNDIGLNTPTLASYSLMLGLSGLSSVRDAVEQLGSEKNTRYIHVPLSGENSKNFLAKAIFLSTTDGDTMYELNRLDSGSSSPPQGEFGNLSKTLGAMGVDRIYIQPNHENDKNVLTSIFYDPVDERITNIELQGDFGSHSETPWLLSAIYHKANRSQIKSVHSALSPQVLQALADAYSAYSNRFHCKKELSEEKCANLWESDVNTYTYKPDNEINSLPAQVSIKHAYTDFIFEAAHGETLSLRWSEGSLWPGLDIQESSANAKNSLNQWFIPEWITKVLVAEFASRSREWGYAAMDRLTTKVISVLPQPAPTPEPTVFDRSLVRRLMDGDDIYQVFIDESNSTEPVNEVRLRNPQNYTGTDEECVIGNCGDTPNLLQMPCNHVFCEDCILHWGRQQAGNNSHQILRTPGNRRFDISCPTCRGNIPAEVVRW